MTLRERWTNRGVAWRFPTRSEASGNLRQAWISVRRPRVLAIILLIWIVVLIVSVGMDDNTIPLVIGAGSTVLVVNTAGVR